MSKSKSRTVSFIGDADEVQAVSDTNAPPPLFTKESLENSAIKCVKNKKSKRQHSLSCSSASGLILNNLDDGELRSKDDSHKFLSTNRLPFGKNSRKSRMGLKEHKKGLIGCRCGVMITDGDWQFQEAVAKESGTILMLI